VIILSKNKYYDQVEECFIPTPAGEVDLKELLSKPTSNVILQDEVTGIKYKLGIENGVLFMEVIE
jgi:hypothetical protein